MQFVPNASERQDTQGSEGWLRHAVQGLSSDPSVGDECDEEKGFDGS